MINQYEQIVAAAAGHGISRLFSVRADHSFRIVLQSAHDPHPWSASLRRLVHPLYIGFDTLLFQAENNIRLSFRPGNIIWKLLMSSRREPMTRLGLEALGTQAGAHHHGMNTTCTCGCKSCGLWTTARCTTPRRSIHCHYPALLTSKISNPLASLHGYSPCKI